MLRELSALDTNLAPDGLITKTFIATNQEVATFIQSLSSDEELLHQFTIENNSNIDVEMIDDESDKMESRKKMQPTKKVLFEVIDLIESFVLVLFTLLNNCESILHSSTICLGCYGVGSKYDFLFL